MIVQQSKDIIHAIIELCFSEQLDIINQKKEFCKKVTIFLNCYL